MYNDTMETHKTTHFPQPAILTVLWIPLQVPQITLVSLSGRSLSLELVLFLPFGLLVLVPLEVQ